MTNYAYDLGGQLFRMDNGAMINGYCYLDSVKYDRFGAKVSQTYGNGLVTNYSYDNLTRRLSTITTLNGNSQISTFAYTYDPVGNVTQVTSSCPWLNSQTFSETFTYDASDQLVSASETNSGSYSLSVNYGNWGKINSYSLAQTDLQNNNTQSEAQAYTYPVTNSIGNSQTLFAPQQRTITDANQYSVTESLTFGINGSLRKREVQGVVPHTEHYLFNSAANLKAYSNNGLDFAYYGYNASNTRSYKLSMLNQNQWVNGQPQPLNLQLQSAMFYPNAYLNFNQNGEYTKHYYNGTERIASRLGSSSQPTDATSNDRLNYRLMREEEKFRENMQELVSEWHPVDLHGSVDLVALQPTGTVSDIFFYHTNHLGSTAYVTDQNQNITQGFLYAPFGEITTEYNANFGNDIIPKYSFNAKELDEETGMYYYEARYYKPPVFTSRDPMFEKYFWMTPYAYCANNPVKYVDPSGREIEEIDFLFISKFECILKHSNYNSYQSFKQEDGILFMLPEKESLSQQPKPKLTYEQMISAKLSNLQTGDEISGKDLAEAIGISKISLVIKKIKKSDENTFIVTKTLVGKTILNDSPMKIERTTINNKSAYRIQIPYNEVMPKDMLRDFFIQENDIYYYGENGKLLKGYFPG